MQIQIIQLSIRYDYYNNETLYKFVFFFFTDENEKEGLNHYFRVSQYSYEYSIIISFIVILNIMNHYGFKCK